MFEVFTKKRVWLLLILKNKVKMKNEFNKHMYHVINP